MRAFQEHRKYESDFSFAAWIHNNITFFAHWHPDLELVYVREGELRMGINSESRLLKAGDIAICSSGDIHYYDSRGNSSNVMFITFHPQLVGEPGGWPREIRFRSPFLTDAEVQSGALEAGTFEKVRELMSRLFAEWTGDKQHRDLFIRGYLHELCGTLLRGLPCAEPVDSKSDRRRITHIQLMQKALVYMEENYMNPISLEEMAAQCNMSMFHFSRFFKSIAGLSFVTYLNSFRVQKAEELIVSTNKSIIDIAAECGFTNVRTFNRVFKQVKRCRPRDLR